MRTRDNAEENQSRLSEFDECGLAIHSGLALLTEHVERIDKSDADGNDCSDHGTRGVGRVARRQRNSRQRFSYKIFKDFPPLFISPTIMSNWSRDHDVDFITGSHSSVALDAFSDSSRLKDLADQSNRARQIALAASKVR